MKKTKRKVTVMKNTNTKAKTKLLELLKERVSVPDKTKAKRGEEIFTDKQLNTHLELGLAAVNQHPPFSNVSFNDKDIKKVGFFVVQYATASVLLGHALVERGREWKNEDGVFVAPDVSTMCLTQGLEELNKWYLVMPQVKNLLVNKNAK